MAKLTEVYSEKQFKKFQPVMICNIEKQQEGNKKIYSRSFPIHGHNTNTLGFRSSFNVCKKYKNMIPDGGTEHSLQSRYTSSIDNESTLRNTKTEQYPQNKRNSLIDGDNYLHQLLYNLHAP